MSHSRTKNLAPVVVMLIAAALALAGCQDDQTAPTATPAQPAATVALQPAADTPTAMPTPTEPPATATPTAAPTDTPTPTPTMRPPTPTPAPPPATPTPAPTDAPTAAPQPQTMRSANLRAGPGTNYALVGSVAAQQAIEPVGRNEAGDWLQVGAAAGEAWIATFLVENVDVVALPVRQSTAPTLTPAPQPLASTPAPAAQPAPASGSVSCGTILAAAQDLRYADGSTTIIQGSGPLGTASWTQKILTWRWDELDQVQGLDWYFDLQLMLGGQPGNPVLRTMPLTPNPNLPPVAVPNVPSHADGVWTMMAPGSNWSGGVDPAFFTATCPPGEPRCPLHVRIQVALRDSNGNFACFISAPSNAAPMPLP